MIETFQTIAGLSGLSPNSFFSASRVLHGWLQKKAYNTGNNASWLARFSDGVANTWSGLPGDKVTMLALVPLKHAVGPN